MATKCPECRALVDADNINVAADVGLCRECGTVFNLSALIGLVSVDPSSEVNPYDPPKGTWYLDDGGVIKVGATTKSVGVLVLVPFAMVWTGGSLGIIYGMQIASGQFSLIISLVGLPFLIGSIVLWTMVLMYTAGRVEVTLDGEHGTIFAGVGSLGWRRRILLNDYSSVKEVISQRGQKAIVLEGKRQLTFGYMLKNERRYFIAGILRQMLANRQSFS